MSAPHPIVGSTLDVEVVDDAVAFAGLRSEWDELLHDSDVDGLFLTWEWLFHWWRRLAADATLQLVLLRHGRQLIAIAPLSLRPASLLHVPPVATTQLLGSGVAGSDYLDLIVRRGWEGEAVRVLADHLIAAGRAVSFMRMRPDGPAAALVARMRQQDWRAWQGPSELCPYVSLRGHTFDSYLASRGSEHRYGFRRKLGRLERNHAASFELARSEAERRDALERLFALHELRWGSRGEPGAFSSAALRGFHDDVSRAALDAGWLRLWVLRLDGIPVAALYGFLRARTFYFYQSGFDPSFARDSVGFVLLGHAIRSAIEEGADELDMLHGTERYKAHWTDATRELVRFELHAPSARGLFEQHATRWTRSARRFTRAMIDAVPLGDHANHR